MRKDDAPPPKKEDIPAWFMTYSDVITLLMTFFILLLTFATNEPEMFERMQISLFGGGGATGLAGEMKEAVENDSMLLRERPPSSRLTMEGSEMPPIHDDPASRGVNKGLAGLDSEEHKDPTISNQIDAPLALLAGADGEIYARGRQLNLMLGQQLKQDPCHIKLEVSMTGDVPRTMVLAQSLVEEYGVRPRKIGISVMPNSGIPADHVRLITYWHERQSAE